jgi:hypothetical protein
MLGAQNSHHNRYIVMSAMMKAHGSVALSLAFRGGGMPHVHGKPLVTQRRRRLVREA